MGAALSRGSLGLQLCSPGRADGRGAAAKSKHVPLFTLVLAAWGSSRGDHALSHADLRFAEVSAYPTSIKFPKKSK